MRLRFTWIDCSSYRCIESSTVETVAVALTLDSRRIVTYRLHDQVGAFQLLVLLMHLDLKMMRFQHGSTLRLLANGLQCRWTSNDTPRAGRLWMSPVS